MKKKVISLTLGLIFALSTTVWGQKQEKNSNSSSSISTSTSTASASSNSSDIENTKVSIERAIWLDNDSKTKEIVIPVETKSKKLQLVINSAITSGKLSIEIYDPKGEKQGNFSIGTQTNLGSQEKVRGNISKSLKEPLVGKWMIKIIPSEASGDVHIQTSIKL